MNEPSPDFPLSGSSLEAHDVDQPPPTRRSFLAWAVHGMGALFAAVLGVPAVLYLIDPRNRPAPERGFMSVARLSDLKNVNEPKQFVIRDIRHDAWTLYPNDVIGRVWIVKRGPRKVDVFTTVCPHLGCSVNFEKNVERFICPCHGGTFDIDGHKVISQNNPAPRDMDSLPWRFDPKNADVIQVKYETFKQGEAKKELKT